eukprot:gnl/Hemi2/25009_TR8404_c0_g1_i1.p1 gnl/Hemi2/25009_TR8404_c0_g1~~gnl/Hemi2/25009_TR8404_c0_g1_i1.p1  ORF type:complete len:319 (+),score=97.45 gnl/Hemi2/25009_TR8404_c0_g1_i1:39-995(+)
MVQVQQVIAAVVGVILALAFPFSIHTIPEGHVGVYWRGGALLKGTSEPGWNLMIPYVTSYAAVQVTIQTDKVLNIPCGTSGGVVIHFDRIEVVNQLQKAFVYDTIKNYTVDYDKTWIFDKIHHEINQFCSQHTLQEVYIDMFDSVDERMVKALQNDCDRWAPGIRIIAVRITKPRIPDGIRKNYETMEIEKTNLLITANHQKVVEKEAETARKKAVIEAERRSAVNAILTRQEIMQKESAQKIAAIENQMSLAHQKSYADAQFYLATKSAEADSLRLTPEFLEQARIAAIANNTQIIFGSAVPNVMVGNLKAMSSPGA